MNSGEARGKVEEPQITVIGAGTKVENGGDINESRKDNKVEDTEWYILPKNQSSAGRYRKSIPIHPGRYNDGWIGTDKSIC